jgi:hypothetical protein
MAKKKSNLNKNNSSEWLNDYSEGFLFPDGGIIKNYRVNNNMISDNTRNQFNQNTNQFTPEQLKAINLENNRLSAAKNQELVDRAERIKKSIKAQDKALSVKNLAEQTQAIGDKFRLFPNEQSFIDEYLNPGVMLGNMASGLGRVPLDIQQGNYSNAALSVLNPIVLGRMVGSESINPISKSFYTKELGNKEAFNALLNPLAGVTDLNNISKANLTEEIIKNLENLKPGSLRDNLYGLRKGIKDISKGRPFSETFPITSNQKKLVEEQQNKALQEASDFVKNWVYSDNKGNIRPEVRNRIQTIAPGILESPNSNVNIYSSENPIYNTKNILVNNKKNALLNNQDISNEAIQYLLENKGKVGGVNTGLENITLRNHGLYYNSPKQIRETATHELGHSMQDLGISSIDNPVESWGSKIAVENPNYLYKVANPNNRFGKYMGEAMVEPIKGEYTWAASPLEPHSELMTARMKAYNFYKDKLGEDQTMKMLQNPSNELVDKLIEVQDLNRFFKPNTSIDVKRDIIKRLPALAPLGVSAYNMQQEQNGGYINQYTGGGNINNNIMKNKKGGYLKDKNTYVTKDGRETQRGLWANVYLKNHKYPEGGYLNYQDSYKGFGIGPNLTQDNSYYRSAMPGKIENIQAEINQPSALAGLNTVLGGIDQIASQGISLASNFIKPAMQQGMEGEMGNFFGTQKGQNYLTKDYSNFAPSMTPDMGAAGTLSNPFGGFGQGSAFSPGFSLMGSQGAPMINANIPSTPMIGPQLQAAVPFLRNGGYLKKYQDGGNSDILSIGYPEYIHKSNVFQPHVIPVPRVHFSDDTSVFDMGVNLNDLVQMNGGGIGKYPYGGFMTQPITFNSNSQRANAEQLASATENDFMHTKLRHDRQKYADNKIDWGFMNWAKEPTGAGLGLLSSVPVLGDTVKNVVGDSFLTRTSGYQVGQGVGKGSLGVAKVVAGVPKGDVSMILGGVGDIGEGVGSTVGNLNAESAMGDYNKSGYVSGKRFANAAKDFNTTMGLSGKLYGIGKSAVDLASNPSPQTLNTFLSNKNPYNPANKGQNDLNFLLGSLMPGMQGLSGIGNAGGMQSLSGIGFENGGYLNNYQEGGMVLMPEDMEIPKFKKGGLTAKKAREILHDKSVHGHPLTEQQRKYFGYISSQKKSNGGWLESL